MTATRKRGRPGHPRRDEAVQMVRDGATRMEAAKAVGAAVRSVSAWCREAGMRGKGGRHQPRDMDRERAMVERAMAGETFESIAASYGLSRERVRQIVARHGITGSIGKAIRRRKRQQERTRTCALEGCDRQFVATPGRPRYCSRECGEFAKRGPRSGASITGPDGYAMYRNPDGHWMARRKGGRPGQVHRVERRLVTEALGRKLASNEWVVLLDRNPDNWDGPDNVALMSASAVARCRNGTGNYRDYPHTTLRQLRNGAQAGR